MFKQKPCVWFVMFNFFNTFKMTQNGSKCIQRVKKVKTASIFSKLAEEILTLFNLTHLCTNFVLVLKSVNKCKKTNLLWYKNKNTTSFMHKVFRNPYFWWLYVTPWRHTVTILEIGFYSLIALPIVLKLLDFF